MSNTDALKLALSLAITAPTDAKSAECVAIAKMIAADMSAEDIERCKEEVRNDHL